MRCDSAVLGRPPGARAPALRGGEENGGVGDACGARKRPADRAGRSPRGATDPGIAVADRLDERRPPGSPISTPSMSPRSPRICTAAIAAPACRFRERGEHLFDRLQSGGGGDPGRESASIASGWPRPALSAFEGRHQVERTAPGRRRGHAVGTGASARQAPMRRPEVRLGQRPGRRRIPRPERRCCRGPHGGSAARP